MNALIISLAIIVVILIVVCIIELKNCVEYHDDDYTNFKLT